MNERGAPSADESMDGDSLCWSRRAPREMVRVRFDELAAPDAGTMRARVDERGAPRAETEMVRVRLDELVAPHAETMRARLDEWVVLLAELETMRARLRARVDERAVLLAWPRPAQSAELAVLGDEAIPLDDPGRSGA